MHTDAGALAWWLDHERKADFQRFTAVEPVVLRTRRRHPCGDEAFLAQHLVECHATALDTSAGVANAAFLQDRLNLSVLSERAMNQVHGHKCIRRYFKLWSVNIHLDHLRPLAAQRLGDAFGGLQGHFTFGAGAAHEQGDFLVREIEHGAQIWNERAGLAKESWHSLCHSPRLFRPRTSRCPGRRPAAATQPAIPEPAIQFTVTTQVHFALPLPFGLPLPGPRPC